jgi:SHS2 domain-containing protein
MAGKKTGKAAGKGKRIRKPDGRIVRHVVAHVSDAVKGKGAPKARASTKGRRIRKPDGRIVRHVVAHVSDAVKGKGKGKGKALAHGESKRAKAVGGGRYEVVGTTADVAIKALGRTHDVLFTNAAFGLADLMCDTGTVRGTVMREIVSSAPTEDRLLVAFLTELLVLRESEGLVLSSIEARVSTPSVVDDKWRVLAIVWGEPYDLARHQMLHDVKAVTYHTLEVRPDRGYARVLFDI